ncbi:hypothetical protein SAY87_016489 [Trapa incisa]|uniref:Uncharacterized protein n=1 Tax=Trapa incisa TaxID=236973 RepID=A0AAN7LCJ5_9MYRT|nr:hypothetical protein SAY87_016489 [Trapa incisa]
MAALSRKIRSISLPPRSHPSTARVEEELGKLRSWESSGEFSAYGSIAVGLAGLERLYICLDDLLGMGSTQQVLSQGGDQRIINELLDVSVMILDICGATRDLVLQVKDHLRDLESAVRRSRKEDSSIDMAIVGYSSLRKKTKKDARRIIARLREVDMNAAAAPPTLGDNRDLHFSAVVRALREASLVGVSVFRSVLLFLSGPTVGQAKWSLISRLMLKAGAVESEIKPVVVNTFEDVSAALRSVQLKGSDAEAMRVLQSRFRQLDVGIGSIEDGLESSFRRLVKTRATLLNLICH